MSNLKSLKHLNSVIQGNQTKKFGVTDVRSSPKAPLVKSRINKLELHILLATTLCLHLDLQPSRCGVTYNEKNTII